MKNAKRIIRRVAVAAGIGLLALIVLLLISEIGFRLFYPQTMLTPRYDYLPEIGIINFPNVTMKHRKPGVFHYTYTVNAERYRGELIPFDSPTSKIVVLGDSHSFGIGVRDDEIYSYLLNKILAGRYQVVNLSNGGWGLTQEIARFLSFGSNYHSNVLILQFADNDPADNMLTPLVTWDATKKSFALRPIQQQRVNMFRRMVACCRPVYTLLTGYSQTYNFFRDHLYRLMARRDREQNFGQYLSGQTTATASTEGKRNDLKIVQPAKAKAVLAKSSARSTSKPGARKPSPAEVYYADLLDHFARYLKDSGIQLVMISVQGHLDRFPSIKDKVMALRDGGYLAYLETRDWFELDRSYASPEGHVWGSKAHARIAEELGKYLTKP